MSRMPKLTGMYVDEDDKHAEWELLLNAVRRIINPLKLEIGEITNLQHGEVEMYEPEPDSHRPSGMLIVSQFPYPDREVSEDTYVNLVIADIPDECKFYEITRIPSTK